jgi:hypothetical protein
MEMKGPIQQNKFALEIASRSLLGQPQWWTSLPMKRAYVSGDALFRRQRRTLFRFCNTHTSSETSARRHNQTILYLNDTIASITHISSLQGKVLHCVGDEAECFLFTLVQQTQGLTTSRSIRVEIRLLSKACHASTMPWLLATIIPACVVDSDSIEKLAYSRHCLCGLTKECLPVIPQCTGPRSPFESQLNVDVALINVMQVIQNQITLGPV